MLDADEEVRTDVEKARATGAEVYRGSIVSIASGGVEGGNANVLLHLMERLYPDDYAPPKTRTEVSGPEGKPQEHAVTVTIETAKRIARGTKEPHQ